jgi:hypothetical protein
MLGMLLDWLLDVKADNERHEERERYKAEWRKRSIQWRERREAAGKNP